MAQYALSGTQLQLSVESDSVADMTVQISSAEAMIRRRYDTDYSWHGAAAGGSEKEGNRGHHLVVDDVGKRRGDCADQHHCDEQIAEDARQSLRRAQQS